MEFQRNDSMLWTWSLLALIAIIALDHTTHAVSSPARVCVLGTEPDESAGGRVRFVLPPGDPCSCTHIMLGGHNTYAPPRKDQPVYMDTLPMDVEGLRRSQGCPEINTNDVTSAAPTTTVIPVYQDCQDVLESGHSTNGVYNISINGTSTEAFCDLHPGTPGKGFIVFQKRINGAVTFDRTWVEYQNGFGDLKGEFWWGNDNVRNLTESGADSWELVVDLEAFDGTNDSVRYDGFMLDDDSYYLTFTEFVSILGDAGDALNKHQRRFTTKDQDNDESGGKNCADEFSGGWWYDKCISIQSNLNGKYKLSAVTDDYQGVQWVTWKGRGVSLKGCQMKIRRI